MKNLILVISLLLPVSVQAGILSFLGDVSSISSAMNKGASQVSPDDMKKINDHVWAMYKNNKFEDGYEFYVDLLEKSNNLKYVSTAAFAYDANSNKKKALELYETKILPTGRAIAKKVYEGNYRIIAGLKSDEAIPYKELYQKEKLKREELIKAEKLALKQENALKLNAYESSAKTPMVDFATWGVLVILIMILITNVKILSNQSTKVKN